MQYFDTVRSVFIALALGGIAVYAASTTGAEAAVIAALLTGFAASPWMQAALRYGAIVLAVPRN